MEQALILLAQLAVMFIYVAVGWWLRRVKLVTSENSAALTNLLLYVILPCVIMKSFLQEATAEKTAMLLWSMLLGALALGLAMLASFLIFRKNPVADFGSAFSNAGFMGIPLITAVLGGEAVFFIAGMVALLNILQWTYGQALLSGSTKELKPAGLLKNPMIISFVIGLLLYFLPVTLPAILTNAIGTIAGCNAPVAMVILGVLLGGVSFRTMFLSKDAWLTSLVRLLVIPVLTALLLKAFPFIQPDIRTAVLIAAAAPVGSNLAVYVQRQGGDSQSAAAIVCLSTIFSTVSMPLIMLLA